MDVRNLARILTIQFRFTDFVFRGNLAGLSDEDGFKQPSPGGNCLNWVAGHIVGSLLAGLAFHESYHCGQLGVLRRMAGAAGFVK